MAFSIKRATVLGAGVMGSAIAAHLANAGIPTFLLDIVPLELTEDDRRKGLTGESPVFRNRLAARGWTTGLLGGAPSAQQKHYRSADLETRLLASTPLRDLRGRLTLPQVAGALSLARACITIDNGIMHLAYGVGTPTIKLDGITVGGTEA